MSGYTSLKEFVSLHKQENVAVMMGVSQGAVSQMVRAKRDIRVEVDITKASGYRFYEVRPVGKNNKAA